MRRDDRRRDRAADRGRDAPSAIATPACAADPPGRLAILFRTRESHREFEEALERRGLPSYVYKGLGFFDADEIKDVLALLWYLADPLSDLRAAAWLRSRFVRISDEGLRRLAPRLADALQLGGAAGRRSRSSTPTMRTRWRRRATASRRWRALVDRMPPAELLDLRPRGVGLRWSRCAVRASCRRART